MPSNHDLTVTARRRGPKTPEGRSRVAKNGIKTGARVSKNNAIFVPPHCAVLTAEDRKAFLDVLEQHIRDYNPTCPTALGYVRAAAEDQWCLNRLDALTTTLYEREARRTVASFVPVFAGMIERQRLLAAFESAASMEVLSRHILEMRREMRESRRENLRFLLQFKTHFHTVHHKPELPADELEWANQTPYQTGDQTGDQTPTQTGDQTPDQTPGQTPGSGSELAA